MQRTKPCHRNAQGHRLPMTNSKFGQRTFDQLYAISLDWLYLNARLPLAGGKTDLAGCSKLVHVKQAVLVYERSKLLMYVSMLMFKTL